MQRQDSRTDDRLKILVMLEYISLFRNGNDTADVDSNFDDNGSDDDDDDDDEFCLFSTTKCSFLCSHLLGKTKWKLQGSWQLLWLHKLQ